jgi:hypothetical protein
MVGQLHARVVRHFVGKRGPGSNRCSPNGHELGDFVRRVEFRDEINRSRDGRKRYIYYKMVTL